METYTIEDEIKALREKLGYSQDKFANAIGVSKNTVQNWEYHKGHPARSNVQNLITAFDLKREDYPDLFDFAEDTIKLPVPKKDAPSENGAIADKEKTSPLIGGESRGIKGNTTVVVLIGVVIWICCLGIIIATIFALLFNDVIMGFNTPTLGGTIAAVALFIIILFAAIETAAFGIHFLRGGGKVNPIAVIALIGVAFWIIAIFISAIALCLLCAYNPKFYSDFTTRVDLLNVLFAFVCSIILLLIIEAIAFGIYFSRKRKKK